MNINVKNPQNSTTAPTAPLIDNFGRQVTYLRVSVTDRCDFRCTYCMSEKMKFLPKKEVLSFEELCQIIEIFVERGVNKIRLTGGEPLVRKDIMQLVERISKYLSDGSLNELTLTTNGSQLKRYAKQLVDNGIKRINVSLDTKDSEKFTRITRRGKLEQVLEGIDAADAAGLKIKLNMVAMRDFNEHEITPMITWAHSRGFDLTLIEEMPLGQVSGDRSKRFLSLREVRDNLAKDFDLEKIDHQSGGPARYVRLGETGGRVGFITPMTHNFCESCNRVRLTCTGRLYLCLGRENQMDLRQPLRERGKDGLNELLTKAMSIKPKGHDFDYSRIDGSLKRHMSVTGG
ncbi:Cyclic pyranopterin phosphate synthase (MoaA) [hydrothermal vent metagenome]|uniref:GTP 3',8-cyclase n=1 Tax=hydrothermal vent metagenome TaxID=652676 RepID=A0A3B0U366_9ZZZZ